MQLLHVCDFQIRGFSFVQLSFSPWECRNDQDVVLESFPPRVQAEGQAHFTH